MEIKSKEETIKSLKWPIIAMGICVLWIIGLSGVGLYLVEKKKHAAPPAIEKKMPDTLRLKAITDPYQDTIRMMFANLRVQRSYGDASIKYERLASEEAIKYYRTGKDKYRILYNTYDSLKAYYAKLAYAVKIKP